MHKRILGLIVGAGFLCTQAANANEMVRYEPSLYLAKSEGVTETMKKTTETVVVDKTKKTADKVTKSTKSDKKVATNKKHHPARKHHHARHPQKHCHKDCHKHKHHAKHKRHMTKSGMERYIDKIAPEHN